MTATSGLIVPPCAIDSSHMSIRCPSTFRERSRHRWAAPRQEKVVPVGGVPVRVWRSSRSVVLLFFSFYFASLFLSAHAQAVDEYARNRTALNQQIYFQAFDSFVNLNLSSVKTGVIYNASLPNITNNAVELESIQMVRLRIGSLKRYGVNISEIIIPKGSTVVQSLLDSRYVFLVYRRFKQYGDYITANGTVFVAPVVGILAYDYADISNYTTSYGTELTIVAGPTTSFQVQLQPSRNIASNQLTCIEYNNTVNGSDIGSIKNVTGSSLCTWSVLGDFSLLGPPYHKKSDTWKIIVGSVVGGLAAVVLLILVAIIAVWFREKHRFAGMEQKSDQGEPLHHSWFGASRAPSAAGTRTKPILENENV
ncbi:unnamed protein product [Calypogeia fissa]